MTGYASACSLLFIGGDYTDDGASLFVRVEGGDLNDENKLYLVSPAGKYKAGEEYHGCFGYTWTFTHDSYRYVSRRDDNPPDLCPVCGNTHELQSYEEAGTNKYGLTVSATQSLEANAGIRALDPTADTGINEADLPTILLSECRSAREAVLLLKSIVETAGISEEGSGIMICDQAEQWYTEMHAGHALIAVRLPASVAFFQANLSVLGRLDLDDTENIIASDGLIDLALSAGTFVGDAEQNIIDYRLSFDDYLEYTATGVLPEQLIYWRWNIIARMAAALNYMTGMEYPVSYDLLNTDLDPEHPGIDGNFIILQKAFVMTNIGEDGSVVPLHNSLKPDRTVGMDFLLELLKTYPIGYSENRETHLYRFYPDAEPELGTVEWNSMDNNQYNVFVPCYPVLLTDTWKGYRASLPVTELFTQDIDFWQDYEMEQPVSKLETQKPDTKDSYEMKGVFYSNYDIRDWSGLWHVHPEGWENSFCETFSAMSNYLTYMDPGEEAIALAKERLAGMQQDFEARFNELTARLKAEKDPAVRQEIATQEASRMAEEAHGLALALYRHIVYGEDLPVN